MLKFFAEKLWVAVQKLLTFFRILYIESAKTVNKMTINKLVKLADLGGSVGCAVRLETRR